MVDLDKQKSTKYKPTEKEKTLLEVLINPDYRMKSITDICKAAKCTRNIYYTAFAKPEFVEIYKELSESIVKQSIAPVINAFVREAKRGSFNHGKVLLEMAGLYNKKDDDDDTKTINLIHSVPRPPKDGDEE